MTNGRRSLPDTNTIVRFLVADDAALHAKAKRFFDGVRAGESRARILECVVAECVYVLTKMYRISRKDAAESLIGLMHYQGIINEDRAELIKAPSLYSQTGLDIVDCILCAKAAAAGEGLFTFDADLIKLARHV